jgi:sec-independent protein translocase protein TatB
MRSASKPTGLALSSFVRLAADYPVEVFGLTFEKLLIIGVIAVFLLGPERLPHYAAQLGRLVRSLRDMASGAKDRMRDEMGPDFDDVDWKKLDPRQYDPRRIIREALSDVDPFSEPQMPVVARAAVNENSAYLQRKRNRELLGAGEPAPFDSEAT